MTKIKIAVIGASGYTGADLIRIALRHPNIEIAALTANTHSGKYIDEVFPHLSGYNLPILSKIEDCDWDNIDVAFCGLPHSTSQKLILSLPEKLKIIDMSADFRLRNPKLYKEWYGNEHIAPSLQKEAVYGLSEYYREEIKKARLVACPGCFPTAALLLLLPILAKNAIDSEQIIIDAKTGISGAGRGLKQDTLFCEAGEGVSPYNIARHRHAPEIEQELSVISNKNVTISFTPHLTPMSRGELLTVYTQLSAGVSHDDIIKILENRYKNEPFVNINNSNTIPTTRFVRGSNNCLISVFKDRIENRIIMISTLDNLVKGSSGQAIQNMNIMFGINEKTGLEQLPLFP